MVISEVRQAFAEGDLAFDKARPFVNSGNGQRAVGKRGLPLK
jgi:hypothetical protein